MANEVRVLITGKDTSDPAFRNLDRNVKNAEKAHQSLADKGVSRAGRAMDTFKANMATAGAVLGGVTVAAAAVNKVMGDGIAVSLGEANAQVALGAEGFGRLQAAANANANQMGLTQSEFINAGGSAAMFAKNMGFSQKAAADFGAAMPFLADRLATLSNGQKSTAETADILRSAMAGEFDPLQTLGINISAAVVQTRALAIQQKSSTEITNAQAQAMAVLAIVQEQSGQASAVMATEQGRAAAKAQAAQAELRQAYQDLSKAAVPVLADLTEGAANLLESWQGLVDGGTSLADRAGDLFKVMAPLTNVVDAFTGSSDQAGGSAKQTSLDVMSLADGADTGTKSAKDLAAAVKEATDKIADQGQVALDTREANRAWQESIDDAAASLKENGKTLNDNTEQGRANNETLDQMAEAARDVANAVVDAGGTEADYRKSLERSRVALIKQARQFGMTADQAEDYASQVLGIPRRVNTTIGTNVGAVIGRLRDFKEEFYALSGAFVGVTIGMRRTGGGIGALGGGLRTGGPARAASGGGRSGMTLVGEDGPELIHAQFGSMVHDTATSRQIMRRGVQGGGGGGPVVVNIDIGGRRLGQLLIDPLRQQVKTLGGDVQVALGDNRGRAA